MTDFEGSRTVSCSNCGRPFNTAEGPQCDCGQGEEEVKTMTKMSTGDDATLGNYRKMAVAVFGEGNKAVKFLDDKIVNSPNGENEEVIANERQMVSLLGSMAFGV